MSYRYDRRSPSDDGGHWRDSSKERSDRKHSDSGGEQRDVSVDKYVEEQPEAPGTTTVELQDKSIE